MMMYPILRGIGWGLAGLLYAAAAVVLLLTAGFFAFTPVGWVLLPVLIIVALSIRTRVHRRRATIILGYVEQALLLNMPLRQLIYEAAISERGRVGKRLMALADQLEMGDPLWRALRESSPEITERTAALVERGEALGRLTPTVTRLRQEDRTSRGRDESMGGALWAYPLVLACATLLAVLFFAVLILPKFIDIFADFQSALPPITVGLIEFVQSFLGVDSRHPVPALAVLSLVLLFVAMASIAWQAGFGHGFIRPLFWWFPLVGRTERDRGVADVCFVLEQSIAAGATMDTALREASALDVNPVLRGRVEKWRSGVVSGEGVAEAARASRLPKLVSGMLEVGQHSVAMPEALTFLRRFYDGRYSVQAAVLRAAAMHAAVLAVAGLAGWVILAIFMPLVSLIDDVNLYAMGWTP